MSGIDVFDIKMNHSMRCVLQNASALAIENGHNQVGVEHLLTVLLQQDELVGLEDMPVPSDVEGEGISHLQYLSRVWARTRGNTEQLPVTSTYVRAPDWSDDVRKFLLRACDMEVSNRHHEYKPLEPGIVFVALAGVPSGAVEQFMRKNVGDHVKVRAMLIRSRSRKMARA